jgi:hypothetical protein
MTGRKKTKISKKIPIQLSLLKILPWILVIVCAVIFILIFIGYHGAQNHISYLPDTKLDSLVGPRLDKYNYELRSSGYCFFADANGKIRVTTNSGDKIISDIYYYASYEGTNEKWGLDDIIVQLISDSTISFKGAGLSGTKVNITITASRAESRLDINVRTIYGKNTLVDREALVAVFDIPVSEVYKKNRQIDTYSFSNEYWLQRQGVLFGKNERSALAYNLSGVSSLQLDARKNLLFVNLEYSKDHPHDNIPYQADGGGRWEDQSMAIYKSGEERNNFFSLYIGNLPKAIPRLLMVPYGYLAGYIFTEHADGGNIRSHRAVYFGCDTIRKIEDALGGFAGNAIPVTKSVFYTNPDHDSYSSVSVDTTDKQFMDFLDQLNGTGLYEVCLHSPEGGESDRKMLEESIKFMKDRYDAITWIDHGMESGNNNRECFTADGLNPDSKFYSADIWQKYGTLYFWNSAVEKIRSLSYVSVSKKLKALKLISASTELWRHYFSPDELKSKKFISALVELFDRYSSGKELNSLCTYKGEAYPTPLYWKHPTRTENFYSWVTDYTYENPELWTKKAESHYSVELEKLDKLVSNRGIFINHGYYIRNIKGQDMSNEVNGSVIINPYFEQILEYIARMRDSGDLYLATVRDLMDYWILAENISFKYMTDGSVHVYNNNDKPIHGLAMAVHSSTVLVNGEVPSSKMDGDDMIFWFNIEAKEQVIINL